MILHEVAHRLDPGGKHGPRFVGILIGLLSRHAGYNAESLLRLAKEGGLRVSVQSIGRVPSGLAAEAHEEASGHVTATDDAEGSGTAGLTLGERLLPLLPTTDVWAAIELGIHWRQVRGAAMRLVATGKARWRGTTLLRTGSR